MMRRSGWKHLVAFVVAFIMGAVVGEESYVFRLPRNLEEWQGDTRRVLTHPLSPGTSITLPEGGLSTTFQLGVETSKFPLLQLRYRAIPATPESTVIYEASLEDALRGVEAVPTVGLSWRREGTRSQGVSFTGTPGLAEYLTYYEDSEEDGLWDVARIFDLDWGVMRNYVELRRTESGWENENATP